MILIVDDSPSNVYSLKLVLESNGFEVDTALSGNEALKKILARKYTLVLLDVQMPGMDGFEVAQSMYGLERTKHTAIIFLSSNATEVNFIVKGYDHGAADYILKPVDVNILMLKVKTLYSLYESRLRNDLQQQEITKLYEREKALNEKLLEAQRLAKMANWEFYLDKQDLFCAPEVNELLGLPPEQTIGLSFLLSGMPLEERDLLINFWGKIGEKESFEFIHRFTSPDGTLRYLKQYGRIEREGGVPYKITGIVQDVSQEKAREAETMLAYQRYELVNMATNDLLWDWNLESNQVECNENIHTIYGYTKEDIGLNIEWWQSIIHPNDTQRLFHVFVETAKVRKRNCSCEYRMRCADGTYKEVFNQSYCLYDLDGKLLRVTSAVKDISELKRKERELINTEQKLLQTVENIYEGFFTCNNDWVITYWNNHSEEILKLKKEEAVGRNLWDLFPDGKTTRFFEKYSQCIIDQRPYFFEEYYVPTDSWYRVNVHPSGEGIAVYFEDITSDLLKSLELHNARIQAESLYRATRDVIWEWDLQSATIKVNRNINQLLGYNLSDFTVSLEWWAGLVHPEEIQAVRDSMYDALNAGHDTWEKEYRFIDAAGRYHFMRDRAIILRDENLKAVKVTGSMSDIQELREVELKLQEIAFSNSHEIRKPLANILGLIEVLGYNDVESHEELIELIRISSVELDEVIQKIGNMAGGQD